MFKYLPELARITVAISNNTTSEEWLIIKECFKKAAPPGLANNANKTLKKILMLLDFQRARLLLEILLDGAQRTEDSLASSRGELWDTWSDLSKTCCDKVDPRKTFMDKVFNPKSTHDNIVLVDNTIKLASMVGKWDPTKLNLKYKLQQQILEFLPLDGAIRTVISEKRKPQKNEERKKRLDCTPEEDEAVLMGAVKFGRAWEEIKQANDHVRQERTKIQLEASGIELDVDSFDVEERHAHFLERRRRNTC